MSWWDELRKIFFLNEAFHLPTHHQLRWMDKINQVMCVQTSIEIIFIKVKK